MTSATNPESGTINYTSYDNNGNLLSKMDARSVQTSMTYDVLGKQGRENRDGKTGTA